MTAGDPRTEFGTLTPDGAYTRRGSVARSAMLACPFVLIDLEHYRPDGSCRCNEPAEQARLIREYDYTPAMFAALDLEPAP